MHYLTSKVLKKQTSSGFVRGTKSLRALRAKRCVVGNWIPVRRKSGRIRSHRLLHHSSACGMSAAAEDRPLKLSVHFFSSVYRLQNAPAAGEVSRLRILFVAMHDSPDL